LRRLSLSLEVIYNGAYRVLEEEKNSTTMPITTPCATPATMVETLKPTMG
jgi:hypothetical protein